MKTKHHIRKQHIAFAAACLSLAAAQAATLTDAFDGRPFESGTSASFTGNNSMASLEVNEPPHLGYKKRTIWGTWTAPSDGEVIINTERSSFNTMLEIYTGDSISELHRVASNDDVQRGLYWSRVKFPVKAGAAYTIMVDGAASGASGAGNAVVDLEFTAIIQPGAETGTDAFDSRPTMPSSMRALGIANNEFAGIDLDEKISLGYGGRTVWWRWVAPETGKVTIDTLPCATDTALTVYTGETLPTLQEVAMNNDAPNVRQSRVSFQTMAGQAYEIMVGAWASGYSGRGNIILNVQLQPNTDAGGVVGSNSFATRGILQGSRARGVASNRFFDIELDEPRHGSYGRRTTWWEWTAPADGVVNVNTEGSDLRTSLFVYTGTQMSELVKTADGIVVPNVEWSRAQFTAKRGQQYQIVVDGGASGDSGRGNIALLVTQGAAVVPGKPVAANFAGLVLPATASISGAGFAKATLAVSGRLSLSLKIGADKVAFTGRLNPSGKAALTSLKTGYSVALEHDADVQELTGTVSRNNAVLGSFTAALPLYSRRNPAAAPLKGRRAALLLPDVDNASLPQDTGFGVLTISKTGTAKYIAKLGNGRKVSQSTPLLPGNVWPLFLRARKATDIVIGSVSIDATPEGDAYTGFPTWYGLAFKGSVELADGE